MRTVNEILKEFYNSEIRNNGEVISFYLQWLLNKNERAVSGNEFYIEKVGEYLTVGNIFDENIICANVSIIVFRNFLEDNRHISL